MAAKTYMDNHPVPTGAKPGSGPPDRIAVKVSHTINVSSETELMPLSSQGKNF